MMEYKYVLLKANWGIVIFVEFEELRNNPIQESDIKITDRVSLRMDDSISLDKSIVEKWLVKGIKDMVDLFIGKIASDTVCFFLRRLEFNYAHFQEEGLYCAVQECLARYYGVIINPIGVTFDKATNKYIFDIPNDTR